MAILPKVIYRFNAIPIKIPVTSLLWAEMGKLILKLIWNCRRPQRAKTILRKENKKLEESDFPISKPTYNAEVIKRVCYWYKDRHINQWNRI